MTCGAEAKNNQARGVLIESVGGADKTTPIGLKPRLRAVLLCGPPARNGQQIRWFDDDCQVRILKQNWHRV